MPARADYRETASGRWRLVCLDNFWNPAAQQQVLEIAASQPWSRHPQTLPLRLGFGGTEHQVYLKIFHAARRGAAWKNALRRSKAMHAWRVGLELESAGFAVPVTIAAGEERRAGFLRRAFLLTERVAGQPAHVFLREHFSATGKWSLAAKRAGLKSAAALLRRFHDAGFVHGDLVATNLFVAAQDHGIKLYFMDNDRTRRYPAWLPQPFWKRNLIQLNRMPLAGVTLQDRMRFFKTYQDALSIAAADRALARWLERATRRRRAECDGVDGSGDFRRLMRWSVDLAPPADVKRAG